MKIDPRVKQVLGVKKVNQVGIVVRDMDRAIKNYSEIFGIHFPKVISPEYVNMTYRGKPAHFRIKVAAGMLGDLEIELIQVLEGETAYGEFLEKWGEGLHHFGFDVKNMDERVKTLKELGIGVLQSGERPGVRFVYMDTEQIVGVIFEFVER